MESKLSKFLTNKMSMTEIYQPVIIKELLLNNGKCSKTHLAAVLAKYDISVLDYYKKVLMRYPKQTLIKHNIISYHSQNELFSLNDQLVDYQDLQNELELCDLKISEWLAKRKTDPNSQVNSSLRYQVLKRAKSKCELCGIPASLSPIDVDHIVPKSKKNKNNKITKDGKTLDINSEENLQALCFRCNRAKRDTDTTDFRKTKKLVRDKIPEIIKQSGSTGTFKTVTGTKLLQALNDKLVEEYEEYFLEKDLLKSVEELADITEVLFALAKSKGFSRGEFLKVVEKKRETRGGFEEGVVYEGPSS